MRLPRLTLVAISVAAGGFAARVQAHDSYYTSYCASCHGSGTSTCNGCHAHGTHSSSSKDDINVAGALDKSSYAPGETVTVTVTGGYKSGWVRVLLLDQSLTELARSTCPPDGKGGCTTSAYPVTLTAAAPSTPGTYTWAVAWYGNYQYEKSGPYFGSGNSGALQPGYFTPDADNINHGYQTVSLPSFTVASAAPSISIAPSSLAFGSVTIGSFSKRAFTVSNAGAATLTGSVAIGAGTSAEYSASPSTFSVAPGGSQAVTVTYTPVDTGADSGSLSVSSDDPDQPNVGVSVSGTGVTTALPAIGLAPSSLDLGTVVVGQTSSQTSMIENTGAATLNVTGIARCSTPSTSAEFTWSEPAATPIAIAPGQTTPLTVSYAPLDAGTDTGCLALTSDDPNTPSVELALSGTGQQSGSTGASSSSRGSGCGAGTPSLAALLFLAALAIRRAVQSAHRAAARGGPCEGERRPLL
jgi:hypothetical protein